MAGDDGEDVCEPEGKPLGYWLQELWNIFSEKLAYEDGANDLLDDIRTTAVETGGVPVYYNGDESADDNWIIQYEYDNKDIVVYQWTTFCNQLKRHNRYFPEETKSICDLLDRLGGRLNKPIEAGEIYLRGRRYDSNRSIVLFKEKDMLAPPPILATSGRASPARIPVLYLAKDPKTAIAEVRPWKGSFVCLAEYKISTKIKIVDLNDQSCFQSPFTTGTLPDDLEIKYMAEHLGRAFSEPVSESDSVTDYLPTQYASAFFKKMGYDGICYPSALSEMGSNLVLFDPEKAQICKSGEPPDTYSNYQVTDIDYSYNNKSPYILPSET